MIDAWDTINLYQLKRADIKLAEKAMAMAYFEAEEDFHIKKESRTMKILEKLMHATLKYTIKNGRVYATSPNFEGIAAWLPDDKIFVSTWQYIRSGILTPIILAGRGWLKRMRAYDKLCKEKHQEHANFPHYYLYNLAVHPDHQKKGNASKLLTPILEILDQQDLACYLETSEHNISLYEHFGFRVVDKVDLRDLDMVVWFMLRKHE
ncbi:MAG: N-acetyltransferase [Promethearchaeota archaeon]|nr:MAG: N-acetyltransferase [Candidatus Lokiarchaeota archaeon]